ncbi:hypothetical protein B0H12DRAFT_1203245 [Mycena haematopus]|nr:hypothetical protein B0H12DRAFT_1203245 [Mycena haematopus]
MAKDSGMQILPMIPMSRYENHLRLHENHLRLHDNHLRRNHLQRLLLSTLYLHVAPLQFDLDKDALHRIRNPIQEVLSVDDDPDLLLSIKNFLSLTNASDKAYTEIRNNLMERFPECQVLSHHLVKQKITELTGVVSIIHDMCVNSCVAFTGPRADADACSECGESRWDPQRLADSGGVAKVPRKTFHTIPLGPQLQALWRSEKSAKAIRASTPLKAMRYRTEKTAEILRELDANNGILSQYDDLFSGEDYIRAVKSGKIKDKDMLYSMKSSDCWIYIWVVCDLSPDIRYKKLHVYPGSFIPGPNPIVKTNSFLFPGLYHLAALMREGLLIWDAIDKKIHRSFLFSLLETADGPAMASLDGMTGHMGAYGCRQFCSLKGRRKGTHYYPALLKPTNYDIPGSNHEDVNCRHLPTVNVDEYELCLHRVLSSPTATAYQENRLDTGIVGPSIFSGLPSDRIFPLPRCFSSDFMHLFALNIPDLLFSLWRGTMPCDPNDDKTTWDWVVLVGDVWDKHSKVVARAAKYLPGCFDRPPRNPAEKINSGYKAQEFMTYLYVLCPALLRDILPEKYWKHFCKFVAGLRIVWQRKILREQLIIAHRLFCEFVEEFELLYYQRKASRLHFCRQSIHALVHTVPETIRIGPGGYRSQWTLERTIGNLGEEIKQHSNPYANLSQRGMRRCRVNSLTSMIPSLAPEKPLPQGSLDLKNGFVLLRPCDEYSQTIDGIYGTTIREYFEEEEGEPAQEGWKPRVARWGRLRLRNGQIVRSVLKESRLTTKINRTGETKSLALVSMYSNPDPDGLSESSGALAQSDYFGEDALEVIDINQIQAGVAMIPIDDEDDEGAYFLGEKLGFDISLMGGVEEEMDDE